MLSAEELAEIAPLLLDGGAGAIAWWGIRGSPVTGSPTADQLRDAYRLHALQAALHERDLAEVVRVLAEADVDALIIKGWTAARLYANPGLRPYGDIDVCVAPEQHSAAKAALAECAPTIDVDLHSGLAINQRVVSDLPSFEESLDRAASIRLADVDVPVPAPEDQLALLCIHLLSHGAWRPLWVCDVAVAVEQLPDDFNWDRCLGRSRRLATWIGSTLTLAEKLLGARPNPPPLARHTAPHWLEAAVLEQWGSPRPDYRRPLGAPLTAFRPARALPALRAHWMDPISATMFPGASFNAMPRFPFRLRYVAWKTVKLLRRLPSDVRRRTGGAGAC